MKTLTLLSTLLLTSSCLFAQDPLSGDPSIFKNPDRSWAEAMAVR